MKHALKIARAALLAFAVIPLVFMFSACGKSDDTGGQTPPPANLTPTQPTPEIVSARAMLDDWHARLSAVDGNYRMTETLELEYTSEIFVRSRNGNLIHDITYYTIDGEAYNHQESFFVFGGQGQTLTEYSFYYGQWYYSEYELEDDIYKIQCTTSNFAPDRLDPRDLAVFDLLVGGTITETQAPDVFSIEFQYSSGGYAFTQTLAVHASSIGFTADLTTIHAGGDEFHAHYEVQFGQALEEITDIPEEARCVSEQALPITRY